MLRVLKYLIFLFIIVLGSHEALADKIALHLYLYDGGALPKNHSFYYEHLFSELHSDIIFKRVEVQLGDNHELQKMLLDTLDASDEIEYLIIDTHGTSGQNAKGSWFTSLEGLGVFSEVGVDKKLAQNLLLVRAHMSTRASVYLNACSTFCGPTKNIVERSQTLLNFLGIKDGSIYGAKTKEVSDIFTDSRFHKWKYVKPVSSTMIKMGLFLPAVMAYGSTTSYLIFETGLQDALSVGVLGAFATSVSMVISNIKNKISDDPQKNKGYYLKFKNGQLDESWHVNKYKELKAMLNENLKRVACNFNYLKLP